MRDARDLCRDKSLIVRQRVATINKIKYHAFCNGIKVGRLGKKTMKILSKEPKLELLIKQLENTDEAIEAYNERIEEMVRNGDSRICHYARLIDTIPGFGPHSSLVVAAEIDDINRFPNEFHLFSHSGVVPRIYQSGDKEWKGHITKGNTFLKTTLLQCANIHVMRSKNSVVTYWYENNKYRIGKKKAKVAVMKRLLRVIYWMLKRNEEYHDL